MNKKEQEWLVLLFSLVELNGGDKRNVVLNYINNSGYWYKNDSNDKILTTRNERAWRNDFSYERQHLVSDGYMKTFDEGRWIITEKGKKLLSNLISKINREDSNDKRYYTSVFYQKVFSEQNVNEDSEDQILIDELSNIDTKPLKIELINKPEPIGKVLNNSNNRKVYRRNPDVSRNALYLANNLCEVDNNHKSFIRRNGKTLYMEPHHLIPMSLTDYYGVNLDREQNIFSLCSNCHNQIHYGSKEDVRKLLEKLYTKRKKELSSILNSEITLEDLYKIYKV